MRNYVIKRGIKCWPFGPFWKTWVWTWRIFKFYFSFYFFFAYFYTWSIITFYRVIYPIRNSVTFCCSWRISRSFWKIKRDFNWKNFILLFLFTFAYNIIPCPFLSLVTCDILKKKYINFKENYFVINILTNGNNIIMKIVSVL